MSAPDVIVAGGRARVLTTPKLHRRHHSNQQDPPPPPPIKLPLKLCQEKVVAVAKCKYPPIDEKKAPTKSGVRDPLPDHVTLPLSPASGVSPAYAAMANACSHDHDYVAASVTAAAVDSSRANGKAQIVARPRPKGNMDPGDVIVSPRCLPAPPKPLPPNSPRDAKPPRVASSKLMRRRYVRVDQRPDVAKGRARPDGASKFVFVSTGRTADSTRAARGRAKQDPPKPVVVEPTVDNVGASQVKKHADLKTENDNLDLYQGLTSQKDGRKFDVANDELTAAWLTLVDEVKRQKKHRQKGAEEGEDDKEENIPRHSTPIGDSSDHKLQLSFTSPRPGAETPWIGTPGESVNLREAEDSIDDSAYFSLGSSLMSPPPPPISCESRPGSGSRPVSGARATSGSRPPSGGKRVAASTLSSPSSSTCTTSGDEEDSEPESLDSSGIGGGDKENEEEHGAAEEKRSGSGKKSASSRSSSGKSSQGHRGHRVVTTKKGKKFLRHRETPAPKKPVVKPPVVPAPPRKPHPKREPLPMRLRALPISFWQEPNKLNPSPYSVLPPLPLFRQGTLDDIADIRPVTPPEEDTRSASSPSVHQEDRTGADSGSVIHTSDPDLLLRLFEPLESQNKPKGIRVRRGRPKRTPRVMPPPRLKLDDNPCIIESITEKLFPKLQIDRRSFASATTVSRAPSCAASYVTNDAVTSSRLGLAPELENLVTFNHAAGISLDSHGGVVSLNAPSRVTYFDDVDSADVAMDVTSSSGTRQDLIALPQLSIAQDYSQMLSEVAAVL